MFKCAEREQFVSLFLFNILFFQRTHRKLIKVNVLPGFPGLTNRKCYYCFNYICRWIARICFLPSGLLWYISYTCCLLATFVVGRPSVVFPSRFCYLYACAVRWERRRILVLRKGSPITRRPAQIAVISCCRLQRRELQAPKWLICHSRGQPKWQPDSWPCKVLGPWSSVLGPWPSFVRILVLALIRSSVRVPGPVPANQLLMPYEREYPYPGTSSEQMFCLAE